jgi:hypothetical protein
MDRINLSCWIRIRIRMLNADPSPGRQKWPTNIEKSKEFSCFEVLDVLFLRAEGFSGSLCVLYGGLRITKLHDLKKKSNFFSALNLWHENPGFRTGSGSAIRKNAGSVSELN